MISYLNLNLKGLSVKNFKSYKETNIDLDSFNVIVGPNASGKTNFIDLFVLLKKIYWVKEINPFLDWWGYDNVVWKRDETLPITLNLSFNAYGYDISFETVFTGVGGEFQILKETINVKGIFTLEKEGEKITLKHDEIFFEKAWSEVMVSDDLLSPFEAKRLLKGRKKEDCIEQNISVKKSRSIFAINGSTTHRGDIALTFQYYSPTREEEKELLILSPVIVEKTTSIIDGKEKEDSKFDCLFWYLLRNIQQFIGRTTIIKGLRTREMKVPSRPKKEYKLEEDGSNLHNVVYNLFLIENKLPEKMLSAISHNFPNTSIKFELTTDGRIIMKVFENGMDLNPPNISDGFYKMITIFSALELKPSLIIIDELENSLHPEAISRIIDELINANCPVIVSTHSPAVVDFTEPENLILVEKDSEGRSILEKLKEPEKVKKKLKELGITTSEGWLYGKL